MWIRLTVDLDMVIHEAVAATDAGPHTPCGDITVKFPLLKGVRITRGWTKSIRGLLEADVYRENIGRRARDFVSREFTGAAAGRYIELLEARPERAGMRAADGGLQ